MQEGNGVRLPATAYNDINYDRFVPRSDPRPPKFVPFIIPHSGARKAVVDHRWSPTKDNLWLKYMTRKSWGSIPRDGMNGASVTFCSGFYFSILFSHYQILLHATADGVQEIETIVDLYALSTEAKSLGDLHSVV